MSFAANPRADQTHPDDAPQEGVGAVASDSLAAESIQSGGGFAENENAHVLGVKGGQSTLNTTETSGATVLHPAASGAEREKEDALGAGSDEKGAAGLKYPEALGQADFSGSHNLDGYTGGPSSDKPSTGYATGQPAGDSDFGATGLSSSANAGEDSISSTAGKSSSTSASGSGSGSGSGGSYAGAATGETTTTASTSEDSSSSTTGGASSTGGATGIRPHVDAAPNAFGTVSGAIRNEDDLKVPGKNLTEGDIPETKTFTGDVGGQHDPGRLAEQGFQNSNAATSGAGGETQYETDKGSGAFDVLSSEKLE